MLVGVGVSFWGRAVRTPGSPDLAVPTNATNAGPGSRAMTRTDPAPKTLLVPMAVLRMRGGGQKEELGSPRKWF